MYRSDFVGSTVEPLRHVAGLTFRTYVISGQVRDVLIVDNRADKELSSVRGVLREVASHLRKKMWRVALVSLA